VKPITGQEFARRLKRLTEPDDSRFALFLGAGCSVSSGIPAAADLVRMWLSQLMDVRDGTSGDAAVWAERDYPGYTDTMASAYYGRVIDDLFVTPEQRQHEIERLTEGRDPAFGYAVLAQLMTDETRGHHLNVVLTTNFDDLVADALYLYTNKKPLVINHESLMGFARATRTRPLVVKLHGDARLAPKNTDLETGTVDEAVQKAFARLLADTGLIFIGYGGNDQSIATMLVDLPANAVPWGVYWVGAQLPNGQMGGWLADRKATWVQQRDFDELMLLLLDVFEFAHPKKERLDALYTRYFDTFRLLRDRIQDRPAGGQRAALDKAATRASKRFPNVWAYLLEASRVAKTDPEAAEMYYRRAIEADPGNADVLGNYALFRKNVRRDDDGAESSFRSAILADPLQANNLGNYAVFLEKVRHDHDEAEAYFSRAIQNDPAHANNLGNYAAFLTDVRHDHDTAEAYFTRAIESDPANATNLGNYAAFLQKVRHDPDRAEFYYKRAIEADPRHANALGNYAVLLSDVRHDFDDAETHYRRAIEADPVHAGNLRNYALFLQNERHDPDGAETYYQRAIEADPSHADSLRSYAIYLEDERHDPDGAETYYKRAIEADPSHADALGSYADFRRKVRHDPDGAETYYKRAIEADPSHATALGNYALLLQTVRHDADGAEAYFRRAIAADPVHAHNLSNYALFLETVRHDADNAETYFKRAIQADSLHADSLGGYAVLLQNVRRDLAGAETLYKRCIEVDPDDSNSLGNYAGLLLSLGRSAEGLPLLDRAQGSKPNPDLALELAFYEYAHNPDPNKSQAGLLTLKRLLRSGTRSPGWPLERNVQQARQSGHPEPDFLEKLACVIADACDISDLAGFDPWRG
jgi:Tfp pilus assembly protein PilF